MPLRPESSVSVDRNEFGELVFACDRPAPVIHRTPEELGIPRETRDVPRVPGWFKPSTSTVRPHVKHEYRDRGAKKLVKSAVLKGAASKLQRDAVLRVIGGEPVLMSSRAAMGAEPLDGFIAERRKQESEEMIKPTGRKDTMPAETQQQLVVDAAKLNIDELTAKYGVKQWKVYAVLAAHGVHCVSKPLGRRNPRNGGHQGARAMVLARPKHAE